MEELFVREIVVVLFVAFIGAYISLKLRQPVLLGYLLGGIFLSLPFFKSFVNFDVSLHLAQIGVALLMFATGVEFSLEKLLSMKKQIIIGAFLQLILFVFLTTVIFQRFGFSLYEGLFISAAFSNGATIVILQILEKQAERNLKMGDTIISWLVMQDIGMVAIALIIRTISSTESYGSYDILEAIAKGAIFISIAVLIGKNLIPKVFEAISKLNSLQILLVISFVFCMAIAYLGEVLGLSYTLGAFLAGVMLSDSFVNHEIFSEIRPIRDLFSVLFYVALGTLISVSFLIDNIFKVIFVLLGLLFLKIITTFIVVLFFEKQMKKAFMMSLTLMQGGEFAFIIAQIGLKNRWIDGDFYSLIIVVTVLSILLTPFVMARSERWFFSFRSWMRKHYPVFYRSLFIRYGGIVDIDQSDIVNHVVICGFGRVGSYIGRALEKSNIPFIVIDSSTQIVDYCKQRGIKVIFGEASNIDVLEKADVERAVALVIALPAEAVTEVITTNARRLNPKIKIIARSHIPTDDKRLKTKGVNITVEPEFEAAISIAKKIINLFGKANRNVDKYLKKSRRRQRSKMEVRRSVKDNEKGVNSR